MPAFEFGHAYAMTGRSLVVFGLATETVATRRLRQGVGALLDVVEAPLPG
jgi:glycogen operon protein